MGSFHRNQDHTAGFTLVELIVVISIMAGLLVLSFPVIRSFTQKDDPGRQINQLMVLAEDLKARAVTDGKDYFLYLDAATGKAFVSDVPVDEYSFRNAGAKEMVFGPDLRLKDVEFPGIAPEDTHLYRICFHSQGYSDFALIHLEKEDKPLTIKIEPFLSGVILLERFFTLENCI